jgi:hypothetical protein
MIRDKGRLGWQKAVGYGRRSLGETAMFRYKAVIGRGLRTRTLPAQKTEARVGCSVLNRMTSAVSADIVWRKGVWHCLRDEALICS